MAQIILDSNNNLIQGDFDNATLNNRTKLQTTTTNATTNVYVVPNGSSTSAGVSVANNSSLTNASKIVMATNGTTDTQIISGVNGSGTYLPMSFYTNNTLAMQITTAGNILVASTAAPAFSAYCNAIQSIANNTQTKLQFNVEQFDTNSNYDTTNYRFTPTVAGYYQVSGSYSWQNVINGYGSLSLYKNGSNYVQLSFGAANGATNQYLAHNGGCLIYLNGSTDYIELYGYQVTGASQNTNGTTAIGSYFTAAMIRSA
jgi:hypothetical protein